MWHCLEKLCQLFAVCDLMASNITMIVWILSMGPRNRGGDATCRPRTNAPAPSVLGCQWLCRSSLAWKMRGGSFRLVVLFEAPYFFISQPTASPSSRRVSKDVFFRFFFEHLFTWIFCCSWSTSATGCGFSSIFFLILWRYSVFFK